MDKLRKENIIKANDSPFPKKFSIRIFAIAAFVVLIWGVSCEKEDISHSQGRDVGTKIYDSQPEPGISFDLESDSLEENVEEIYFEAKAWDEDEMDMEAEDGDVG